MNPHTLGGLERTILVRTNRMRSASVDPKRRLARVGAGAVWSDVVTAAEPHGLTPIGGVPPHLVRTAHQRAPDRRDRQPLSRLTVIGS
jgi:hypothetical protein